MEDTISSPIGPVATISWYVATNQYLMPWLKKLTLEQMIKKKHASEELIS